MEIDHLPTIQLAILLQLALPLPLAFFLLSERSKPPSSSEGLHLLSPDLCRDGAFSSFWSPREAFPDYASNAPRTLQHIPCFTCLLVLIPTQCYLVCGSLILRPILSLLQNTRSLRDYICLYMFMAAMLSMVPGA